MANLLNLVRVTTTTTGTGSTIAIGSAVSGYLTPALAGAVNATVYDYGIKDGANSETGTITYSSSGPQFTGRTVTKSTNSNAEIALSGSAEIYLTARAETLNDASLIQTGTMTSARLGTGGAGAGLKALFDDQTFKTVTSPLDFRNILYANGAMEVWQRGAGGSASFAVAASTTFQYTADRWFLLTGATQASVVAQIAGLSTRSRWAARVRRNSGQTGTGVMRFEYPLTTDEVIQLRGQNITFSAWLATGANWSPSSGNLVVNAYFGTGAEGRRGASGYTGETNPLTTTLPIAANTAAAQYTFTGAGTVATNVTQGCLQFSWTPVGTAGAADDFSVDDVQLEVGSIATDFERAPFVEHLRHCQAHYCKSFLYSTAPAQNAGITGCSVGMSPVIDSIVMGVGIPLVFPVQMRVAPTMTAYNPVAANANSQAITGTSYTAVGSIIAIGTQQASYAAAGGGPIPASSTAGAPLGIHYQADAGL